MNEAEHQREDRELDRQLEHREELEREDIMSIAVGGWLESQRAVIAPRGYALIANGIAVRVGAGKRRTR